MDFYLPPPKKPPKPKNKEQKTKTYLLRFIIKAAHH
jgi:hypothetical protein